MMPLNCSVVLQKNVIEDLDPLFICLAYKMLYYVSYSIYFGASAKAEPFPE